MTWQAEESRSGKLPRNRLKFEIIPTVALLLFLSRTRTSPSILMHDVIDSPMARREKTVAAGATIDSIVLRTILSMVPRGIFPCSH